jgi:hypothetical protein
LGASIPGSECFTCTDTNCKDCPDNKCVECQDNYYVKDDKCEPCDIACEDTCSGAGPKACT